MLPLRSISVRQREKASRSAPSSPLHRIFSITCTGILPGRSCSQRKFRQVTLYMAHLTQIFENHLCCQYLASWYISQIKTLLVDFSVKLQTGNHCHKLNYTSKNMRPPVTSTLSVWLTEICTYIQLYVNCI